MGRTTRCTRADGETRGLPCDRIAGHEPPCDVGEDAWIADARAEGYAAGVADERARIAAPVEQIVRLIEQNGCDCECDCVVDASQDHGSECEPCLACRIAEPLHVLHAAPVPGEPPAKRDGDTFAAGVEAAMAALSAWRDKLARDPYEEATVAALAGAFHVIRAATRGKT